MTLDRFVKLMSYVPEGTPVAVYLGSALVELAGDPVPPSLGAYAGLKLSKGKDIMRLAGKDGEVEVPLERVQMISIIVGGP